MLLMTWLDNMNQTVSSNVDPLHLQRVQKKLIHVIEFCKEAHLSGMQYNSVGPHVF